MLNKDKPVKHKIYNSKYGVNFAEDYKKIDQLKDAQAKEYYYQNPTYDVDVDLYNSEIDDKYQTAYAEILHPIFNKLAEISQKRINENQLIKTFVNNFNMISEIKQQQEQLLSDEESLMKEKDKYIGENGNYPSADFNNLLIASRYLPACYQNFYSTYLNQEYYLGIGDPKLFSNLDNFDEIYRTPSERPTEETQKKSDELREKANNILRKMDNAKGDKYQDLEEELNLCQIEQHKCLCKKNIERAIDFCNIELNKTAIIIEGIKKQIDLEVVQEFFTEHPKYLECNFSNVGMPKIIQVFLKQMIKERELMISKSNVNEEKTQDLFDNGLER